jgi:hypothetical protein
LIPVNKNDEKHLVGVDGDADVLSLEKGAGLGATTETIRKRNVLSQELEQTKKRKPCKLRWLKNVIRVIIRIK